MPSIVTSLSSDSLKGSSPSPKVILRDSASSSKRPRDDDDDVDASSQRTEQPHKKRKVAFAPQLDVKDSNQKSLALIREEVRQAIIEHNKGNDEHFSEVVAIFEASPDDEDAPSDALVSSYLSALISNASMLKRPCSGLVHAVLGMQWLARDEKLVQRYDKFLTHLTASNAGYISACLKMLVNNFAHLSTSAGKAAFNRETNRPSMLSQVHTTIHSIIDAVPSAIAILSNVLASSFPFIDDSKRAHVEYVRNLLRLADSIPELSALVLDLIMDRLTKIDVQVQTDLEDLPEDVTLQIMNDEPFNARRQLDDDDEDDDDSSDSDSDVTDEEIDSEERRLETLRSSVHKLDRVLDLMFEYCNSGPVKGRTAIEQSTFSLLLSHFRNTLLKTYRSRHAQFLIFHAAQESPELSTRFIDSCMDVLKDSTRSDVLRVSATAYAASFVSRSVHMQKENISFAFQSLATFVNDQRRLLDPTCRGPELRRYGPYYAAVQAMIYIFCFRWRHLLTGSDDAVEADDEDLTDNQDLVWPVYIKETFTKNFASTLNPLKVCAPGIVEEFAELAYRLKFMYIYPTLEANKRLRLGHNMPSSPAAFVGRETALTNLHGERYHQLDAYFPFDPYQLPLSKRWIKDDYNEWQGLPDTAPFASPLESDSSIEGVPDEIVEDDDDDDDSSASDDDD